MDGEVQGLIFVDIFSAKFAQMSRFGSEQIKQLVMAPPRL